MANVELYNGIAAGNLPAIQAALNSGANVNQINFSDTFYTPLFKAITTFNPQLVQFLIEKGADVNIGNKMGINPLWQVLLWIFTGRIFINGVLRHLSHQALQNLRLIAKKLISAPGANVNIPLPSSEIESVALAGEELNITPLMAAVLFYYKDTNQIIKDLILHGADVNSLDEKGRSLMYYVMSDGWYGDKEQIDVLKLLFTYGLSNWEVLNDFVKRQVKVEPGTSKAKETYNKMYQDLQNLGYRSGIRPYRGG